MKREFVLILSITLLLTLLLMPIAAGIPAIAGTTPTTTLPLVTTTTTWVLTGPDGTAPTTYPTTTTTGWDCISTPAPTTGTTVPAVSPCGPINDVLSNATITESDTMAILAHPSNGGWLSADCYSYDGGTLTIEPFDAALNDGYDYLHLTITANVPFSIIMDASGCFANPMMWFPEEAMREDGFIEKGSYVLSGDVTSAWTDPNPIKQLVVSLSAPGSVTVGHIALSNSAVCNEAAPKIQTTTRPSFPWDDTTTAPDTTTTNPTVGDALLPGDFDGDGFLSTSDARLILSCCLSEGVLDSTDQILADYNGDGYVSTADARMLLYVLLL